MGYSPLGSLKTRLRPSATTFPAGSVITAPQPNVPDEQLSHASSTHRRNGGASSDHAVVHAPAPSGTSAFMGGQATRIHLHGRDWGEHFAEVTHRHRRA